MEEEPDKYLNSLSQIKDFVKSCDESAQSALYKIHDEDLPTYIRLHRKKDSDNLLILFNGAVNREKTGIMTFQRWSWAKDFDANVLNISDGTLATGGIQIGWGVGNESFWFIDTIDPLITKIMEELEILESNLTLYGSSSGGFQAIACGLKYPNCNIIMENPQTDVRKYYASAVEKLAANAFPNFEFDIFCSKFEYRLAITSIIGSRSKLPRTLYIQNINDDFHMKNHALPLLNHLREIDFEENLFEFHFYFGKSSHTPMDKEKIISLIETFVIRYDDD